MVRDSLDHFFNLDNLLMRKIPAPWDLPHGFMILDQEMDQEMADVKWITLIDELSQFGQVFWAVVLMVKWSACSPLSPTIQDRILLQSTISIV